MKVWDRGVVIRIKHRENKAQVHLPYTFFILLHNLKSSDVCRYSHRKIHVISYVVCIIHLFYYETYLNLEITVLGAKNSTKMVLIELNSLQVRWENGKKGDYSYGADGKYEIELW